MKQFFIDTETTGTDPARHAIIQIAGQIVIDGDVRERFEFFLRPHEGAEIEDAALAVSGHTREEIAAFPPAAVAYCGLSTIMRKYVDKFSKTDKFFFVGYNAGFDMDFMRALWNRQFDKYFGSWFFFPSIDVMMIAAWILAPRRASLPNFKLGTVAQALGIQFQEKLHDAQADIELTRLVLSFFNSEAKS